MSPLIDVHCHVTPFGFPEPPAPEFASRWPCMRCTSNVEATLMIGDTPFRALDDRSWDGARRLEDMDREGISMQALSPMPELLSYWIDIDGALVICDHVNAQIASLVAGHPDRFCGLGAVPLQAPEKAADYLARVRSEFGLLGVEIGSNINGQMLGEARFDPFWAAAEELGMAVFVHALHPVAVKSIAATPVYTAFAGFPIDVAMTAASMMMTGVFQRFPRLRIGFSHGGGALSAILGRLDRGWDATEGYGVGGLPRPSAQAKSLFYDSNVYDAATLRHLINEIAPGQVFAGTDYPYPIAQKDLAGFLERAGLAPDEAASLRHGAAERFLGLQHNG